MAGIDPSIPMSFRLPQIEGPADQYRSLLQLQQMMQQREIGKMQMQETRRKAGLQQQFQAGLLNLKTPEERAAWAAQFSGPEALLTDAQRRAAVEANKQTALSRIAETARSTDSLISHRIAQEQDATRRFQLQQQQAAARNWYNEQMVRQGGERLFHDTGARLDIPPSPQSRAAPTGPLIAEAPTEEAAIAMGRSLGAQPFNIGVGHLPESAALSAQTQPQPLPAQSERPLISATPDNLDARDLRLRSMGPSIAPAAAPQAASPTFAGSPREQARARNQWLLDQSKSQSKGASGPASEEIVSAIIEGRMPLPTGFALRSPYWQSVMERVAQKDPRFDASRYGARAAARRTFASGPEARNVTALNTVIGHLGTLSEAANALQNNDVQVYNAVQNRIRTELGDPRVVNFNTAKLAVAEELMRVFRGGVGASVTEAQEWAQLIKASGSPAQLNETIATIGTLLESRVDAIAQQFERSVNQGGNPASIDPKNRRLLDTLKGNGWTAGKEQRYQELLRKQGGGS